MFKMEREIGDTIYKKCTCLNIISPGPGPGLAGESDTVTDSDSVKNLKKPKLSI